MHQLTQSLFSLFSLSSATISSSPQASKHKRKNNGKQEFLRKNYDHTTKNPHPFLNGSLFFSTFKQIPPPWLLKLTTFLHPIHSTIHGPSPRSNHAPIGRVFGSQLDMTMVPAHNHLITKHHPSGGGYVGGCGGDHLMNGGGPVDICDQYYYYYYHYYSSYLGFDNPFLIALDPPMAEDDSTNNNFNEEPPSNRDDGWLELSIGSGSGRKYDQRGSIRPEQSSGLVELELLPGSRDIPTNSRLVSDFLSPEAVTTARMGTEMGMPLFLGTSSSSNFVQQEINWAFRPLPWVAVSSSSPSTSAASSSSFLPVGGRPSSYLGRPFIQFQRFGVDAAEAGPSSDVRIINPPRRPHSGIWFTLKALENQAKEPFLPQISKNYLRIKDEKMTVRLVMKYLVNKLQLDSESEIEIRCRGQEVVPFWTLEHVRDNIWTTTSSSNSLFTLLPHSSTTNHLMILHYGRKN